MQRKTYNINFLIIKYVIRLGEKEKAKTIPKFPKKSPKLVQMGMLSSNQHAMLVVPT